MTKASNARPPSAVWLIMDRCKERGVGESHRNRSPLVNGIHIVEIAPRRLPARAGAGCFLETEHIEAVSAADKFHVAAILKQCATIFSSVLVVSLLYAVRHTVWHHRTYCNKIQGCRYAYTPCAIRQISFCISFAPARVRIIRTGTSPPRPYCGRCSQSAALQAFPSKSSIARESSLL